jgi:hypothetical protein
MSTENELVLKLVMVRHTPLTEILLPGASLWRISLAAITRLPDCAETTLPTSSIIPVNTSHSSLNLSLFGF